MCGVSNLYMFAKVYNDPFNPYVELLDSMAVAYMILFYKKRSLNIQVKAKCTVHLTWLVGDKDYPSLIAVSVYAIKMVLSLNHSN